MTRRANGIRLVLTVIVVAALGASCATLEALLEVERPHVRVEAVRLTALGFEGADLVADIVVENPNRIAVSLTGLDYTVSVEERELLSGGQRDGVTIAAFGSSRLTVPFTVGYGGVAALVRGALEQDEIAYQLDVDVAFDLPLLGAVSVPLSQTGSIPVVKPPTVSVSSLSIESIGITGADLTLRLRVENPNRFAVALALGYSFAVQDQVWATGAVSRRTLAADTTTDVPVSFGLQFNAFGRTVRDLLLGTDAISFALRGDLQVEPELALVPATRLPLSLSGSVPLRRR